jgi:hypothetical protein
MESTLATDLKRGYEQVAGGLTEEALALVTRARDSSSVRLAERNRLLAEIVAAYRVGPRELWGPVILDLLAPGLLEIIQLCRAEPPAMDEEEIRQQLVMEILSAAATIPIHKNGRDMKVRLFARAYKYVTRWLEREGHRQSWQVSYEALRELER